MGPDAMSISQPEKRQPSSLTAKPAMVGPRAGEQLVVVAQRPMAKGKTEGLQMSPSTAPEVAIGGDAMRPRVNRRIMSPG